MTVNLIKRFAAILICVVIVFSVSAALAVHAREAGKTVRVGWFEAPFNQYDRFGRRSGYAYEFQQKIAAYTGWTYEYVEASWPELLQMLTDGEIDMLSDVSFTEERAGKMLFPSVPMGAEEYYMFAEPDAGGFKPGNYAYFNGKRVGVNKGSVQRDYLGGWLKTYGIKAEIVELVCTAAESFQMLKKGELDGFVSLDVYGTTGSAVPVARIGASDIYFAVRKDRPDLLKELDAALIRIQDEDRFYGQKLFQKYVNTFGANINLSEAESAWLKRHGAIRVGYQDNCLAFCAADENGALTGVLKDYLEEASDCLANAHLDFKATPYPSAEAVMKALKKGEIDCMFPSNLSAYDGEQLDFSLTPPIIRAEVYALVRKAELHSFAEKNRRR